ncbi:hypothetical protein EW146_g2679 [Bondarzewia mesenterica]|uniref:NADP-dependent oxidoreductase domain-containing protein n=1 Tax=Bondarzewia mesenterica TaxID=1095465 RepID=A0A4S4M619_9AGAM|nr:hypothetical protein EW146_g2679 [Bondarzewia mesenterica]
MQVRPNTTFVFPLPHSFSISARDRTPAMSETVKLEFQPKNMPFRRLGSSGLRVPVFALGGWLTIGGTVVGDPVKEIIRTAFENGINMFDEAENYSDGKSELELGRVIKELGFRRTDLVITTKLFWGTRRGHNDMGLSRKHVIEGARESLRRLQLDYVDVIFAHRPDPTTPIEETVRAFHWVIEQGLAFYWGTSQWSAREIEEAHRMDIHSFECCLFSRTQHKYADVAEKYGLHAPVAEHLFDRERAEGEFDPLYKKYNLGTTVFSGLAGGILTGKYNDGFPEGSRYDPNSDDPYIKSRVEFLQSEEGRKEIAAVRELTKLAETELGCKVSHLALAWIAKNPNTSSVILGATSPEQVLDNLKAIEVIPKLTPEILDKIEAIVKNKPTTPVTASIFFASIWLPANSSPAMLSISSERDALFRAAQLERALARQSVDDDIAHSPPHLIHALRSRRNEFAPISQLPVEIMTAVFKELTECIYGKTGYSGQDRIFGYDPGWIVVLQVCLLWRNIALAFPALWTNIVFTKGRLTEVMLQRAKNMPLNLLLGITGSKLDDRVLANVSLVLPYISRARMLSFYGQPVHLLAEAGMQLPSTLKKLHLHLDAGSPPVMFSPSFLPESMPNLQVLSVQGVGLPLSTTTFPNLTVIELRQLHPDSKLDITQLMSLLGPVRRLHSLKLSEALKKTFGGFVPCEFVRPPIDLRRLVYFSADESAVDSDDLLYALAIPPERNIYVEYDSERTVDYVLSPAFGAASYSSDGSLRKPILRLVVIFDMDGLAINGSYNTGDFPNNIPEVAFQLRLSISGRRVWNYTFPKFIQNLIRSRHLEDVTSLWLHFSASDRHVETAILSQFVQLPKVRELHLCDLVDDRTLLQMLRPSPRNNRVVLPDLYFLNIEERYRAFLKDTYTGTGIADCLLARQAVEGVTHLSELRIAGQRVPSKCLSNLESLRKWTPP